MRLARWLVPVAALVLLGVGVRFGAERLSRSGSPSTVPGSTQLASRRPADAEVEAFIHLFMQARVKGDTTGMEEMLASNLSASDVSVSKPESRITGYTAALTNPPAEDAFLFQVKVAYAGAERDGQVVAETVEVQWPGGLKVRSVAEVPEQSLALRSGTDQRLFLYRGSNQVPAATLAALPSVFRPHGADRGIEFGVGKDGWAVAVPSFNGIHVFWATAGLHPLLGVSAIHVGGVPTVVPLDVVFEAGVVEAAWAPDGDRYVAVTIDYPSGSRGVVIWDVVAKTKFDPDVRTAVQADKYAVQNIRWSTAAPVITFDVEAAGRVSGPWMYNLSTDTLTAPR